MSKPRHPSTAKGSRKALRTSARNRAKDWHASWLKHRARKAPKE